MSNDDRECSVSRGECEGDVMVVPDTDPQKFVCEHHFNKHFA